MKDVIRAIRVGDRVVVLGRAAGVESRHGAGVVVSISPGHAYVGVRFDGEEQWYEWPGEWCWAE